MFGQGLVRMFADDPRFQVLDWDSNGQEVLERIQALKPDLVILDRTMPKSGAAELMAGMAAAGIRIPCLVLNMMQGLGAPRGPRGGVAKGSLTLDASFEELTVLALATASGDAAQGDRGLPAWPESKWSGYELTRREAEVLRLVGQGPDQQEDRKDPVHQPPHRGLAPAPHHAGAGYRQRARTGQVRHGKLPGLTGKPPPHGFPGDGGKIEF